jgi:TetR/AcrR family transcriptional repressor of lmrAB and yxaGH operons
VPRRLSTRAEAIVAVAEVFRTHGFEGASLSAISSGTGLGKGSLYNFFPGGKEEMAAAVLDEINAWFSERVFRPLRQSESAEAAIEAMLDACDEYFLSGRRICLVGAFALSDARDRFAARVRAYFVSWADALTLRLRRDGLSRGRARDRAEEMVEAIQGALVLSRAFDDASVFMRALKRMRRHLKTSAL